MPKFSETTDFLLQLAEKAGAMLLSNFRPEGIAMQEKSDGSAITALDVAINQMVIDEVSLTYPEYQVLGEECSTNNINSSKLFVVDPIDGTRMFAMGCPIFNFSAAVVIDGIPVAGVIKNPVARRTLIAEKNNGTWLVESNKKLSVNSESSLLNSIIETTLQFPKGKTICLRSVAEVSALISTGNLMASIYLGQGAHDIAAGKIIVEEAGGLVTDIFGLDQRYDTPLRGAILSNKALHQTLVDITASCEITRKA